MNFYIKYAYASFITIYMNYIYFQNLSIIQNYFQLVKNLHKSALMFKVENFLLDNKSVRTR